jgi:hypothetical protein
MKYQVKSDNPEDFEITEVKIIRERTRARIVSWTLLAWLVILGLVAAEAIAAIDRTELQAILSKLTPLVTMAFGWYLGREGNK